ncbi:MAG: autotransporter domain-containing protein [Chlamydiota bacterium]
MQKTIVFFTCIYSLLVNNVYAADVIFPGDIDTTGGVSFDVPTDDRFIFTGLISGTGSFTKTGEGILLLSNPSNTYEGGTVLEAGSAQIEASGNYGVGPITVESATLELTQPAVTIANDLFINNGVTLEIPTGSGLVYNGIIDGTGSLTKTGSGDLSLGAVNPFRGNGFLLDGLTTLLASGGTLGQGVLVIGDATVQADFSVGTEQIVQFTGDANVVVPAGIVLGAINLVEGEGSLNKSGPGVLILESENTYSGGTFLQDGIIEILTSTSLGTGDVTVTGGNFQSVANVSIDNLFILNADTGFDVAQSTLCTINGTIVGTGSVTKGGTGDLIFTANNLFSGGLNLNEGRVIVSSDESLGLGPVALNGGVLQCNTTSTILNEATLIIDATFTNTIEVDANATFTMNGVISGGSNILKIGDGTLVFGNINTFATNMTVSEGILLVSDTGSLTSATTIVQANGTLDGNGRIGITEVNGGRVQGNGQYTEIRLNAGTIAPGNSIGRIDISGDYTQAADTVYALEIDTTSSDQIVAGGVATIDTGAILTVLQPEVTVVKGTTYEILQATGGINQLWTVTNFPDTGTFDVSLINGDTAALLTVTKTAQPLRNVAPGNPTQVQNYLLSLDVDTNPELVALSLQLDTLSGDALNNALNTLHPALFGAFPLANVDASSQVTRILASQNEKSCVSRFYDEGSYLRAIWISPFGLFIDTDEIEQLRGFSTKSGGILLGCDGYLVNGYLFDGLLMGSAIGYTYTNVDWDSNGGSADLNKVLLGFYLNGESSTFFSQLSLVGGVDLYTTKRNVHVGDIKSTAQSDHVGGFFTAHGGFDWFFVPSSPFAIFSMTDYNYLYEPTFTETGAGALNLRVEHDSTHFFRFETGGKFATILAFDDSCLEPMIALSWVAKTPLGHGNRSGQFTSALSEPTSLQVTTFDRTIHCISPEVSLKYEAADWATSVGYKGEFSHNHYNNQVMAKVDILF